MKASRGSTRVREGGRARVSAELVTAYYGERMNWKWEEGNLHLYKISRASAEALAHTSDVVDDAPEAF
jgi:hypothetical protein